MLYKITIILVTFVACMLQIPASASADDRIRFRDSQGRIIATATVKQSTIQLRDGRGRLAGSVTVKGNTAVVRDSRGRIGKK
jgi:YD repeat-containing protein